MRTIPLRLALAALMLGGLVRAAMEVFPTVVNPTRPLPPVLTPPIPTDTNSGSGSLPTVTDTSVSVPIGSASSSGTTVTTSSDTTTSAQSGTNTITSTTTSSPVNEPITSSPSGYASFKTPCTALLVGGSLVAIWL
ncbi:hypothetical protein BKA62DRAFT_714005 [Auriculariales sp. MPI-PUGE-AT-0066]|nr:hypothetical protein BKA62DRAFT_714005 [Auriculariales sp. MPI-PUGE-AT-0066]